MAFGYQSSTTVKSRSLSAPSACAPSAVLPEPPQAERVSIAPVSASARIRFSFMGINLSYVLKYVFYRSPRQRMTFFSTAEMTATSSMATTDSSTMGANTPAPSSWVSMRRLK